MKPEGSNNSDKDFSRVENVLLARGHTPDIERMEGGQPARYKKVFETLAKSTYEGIPGVFKIEGKLPGPTLGITVCTHGDEPAGLAAAEYVMTTVANNRDKLSGSIIVVLNNAIETERYFDSKTSDEARHHRLSEVNMNRIPKGALENPNDHRYEIARVRMLLPVYAEFDAGIDIHSTTQEAEPMIIPLGSGLKPNLIKGMPIRKILSNIDSVISGTPVTHYFGAGKKDVFRLAIEAGSHENASTFECATESVQALLRNMKMYESEHSSNQVEYEEYFITDTVFFPDESYELTKLYANFEFIPKGTVMATGNGAPIKAKEDCHGIMAARKKPLFLDEEVMFLSKPVRKIKV